MTCKRKSLSWKKKQMPLTTKTDSWSQWNAEFCLCAQLSTKQINTSGIETGIYKQIYYEPTTCD